MSEIRIHLIIEGRVQGVWFRESTRREAVSLGVSGWVKNRTEGSVEVVVEGGEEAVRNLASWCSQGPPMARVDKVHENQEEWADEFDSFDIEF